MKTLVVKCADPKIAAARTELADRALAEFPEFNARVLCFLDDEDAPGFRDELGDTNRAVYIIPPALWNRWPWYLAEAVYRVNPIDGVETRFTDEIVYLHGTTCENDVGLVMSLAHELQHCQQRETTPSLWAANSVVSRWLHDFTNPLKMVWSDVPTERDARIVAKRVAEKLCGSEYVAQFVDTMLAAAPIESDAADWRFIRSVTSTTLCDLEAETRGLYSRLRDYRNEIESELRALRGDQIFDGVNLDDWFGTHAARA